MSEELPVEVYRGTLTVMGVELEVVHLDNGQRLFVGDGYFRLLEKLFHPDGPVFSEQEALQLAQAIRGRPE